jgi:TonB family protein
LIHFDFDDRYLDEQVVGTAIPLREAVVVSIVVHTFIALMLIFGPQVPFVKAMLERNAEELRVRQERERPQPPKENRTFVFVQPRVDLEAPKPPPRPELSDKDRMAQTVERPPNPTNPMPYMRGNSSNRVEAAEMERPRGPESPAPPAQGEVAQAQPPQEQLPRVPAADAGLTLPREEAPQARAGSGALGEAMRNLQKYVQREQMNNPGGGDTRFGPFIQFDTKGVEFGPWIRRFVAQVKRNWNVPYAAMMMRGHVVLQFNVHKDGRITDVTIVGPSSVEGFNNASANAILASNPTEPLPPEYPSDRAFFTVTFFYNEEPSGQ